MRDINRFFFYVGSKKMLLKQLFKQDWAMGGRYVEVFAGSAILSLNLASEAWINDTATEITDIIENFESQKVPRSLCRESGSQSKPRHCLRSSHNPRK